METQTVELKSVSYGKMKEMAHEQLQGIVQVLTAAAAIAEEIDRQLYQSNFTAVQTRIAQLQQVLGHVAKVDLCIAMERVQESERLCPSKQVEITETHTND